MEEERYWMDVLARGIASERSVSWNAFLLCGGKSHTKKQCKATRKAGGPKNCVIHRPSEHLMRSWPLILRSSTLLERQCPHGVGHPDPDSAAYLNWRDGDGDGGWDIHGCDGCCGGTPAR